MCHFENGYIFFWPDIGAVGVRELRISFTGFHVFGETDELSASDEPYFINGVVPIITGPTVSSMTRIYDDVDAGMSVSDDVFMFQGPPQALTVTITLYDHDMGPQRLQGPRRQGARHGSRGSNRRHRDPPGGGSSARRSGPDRLWHRRCQPEGEVNSLLGTADDLIASTTLAYSAKDVLRLASTAGAGGNPGRIETPLLSGDGASYKAYFDVQIIQ